MMRLLGLIRIGLGALFLIRTTALARLFRLIGTSPETPLLGWPAASGHPPFAAFAHLPDRVVETACIGRTMAVVLFMFGLWTRPAGLVGGALAYLVATQDPPAFTTTMHVLFLGLMVLACTDAGGAPALRPAPTESPRSSLGLVRIWIASIYVWAGLAKLNSDWLSGGVLGIWVDQRLLHGPSATTLPGTAARRALTAPAVAVGEIALGALLLVRPTRRLALMAAYLLHAIFQMTMAPDVFGWVMAVLLMAFFSEIGPWRNVFRRPVLAPGKIASVVLLALVLCTASACSDRQPERQLSEPCADPLVLPFVPNTQGADEAYVCFGFDVAELGGGTIGAVIWTPPPPGPFFLHHAKLYAVPGDFPDGPVLCGDGMPPGALGLDVWAPGATNLILPADVGLLLPAGTRRLVVEAHTIGIGAGTPHTASVTVCKGPASPAHTAALMAVAAPVPAIRPLTLETSDATCALAGDLHLYSVWPHMHLIGDEIAVDGLGGDGGTTVLMDVVPWNFYAQATYPLGVDLAGGAEIRIQCTWNNTNDSYVFPGSRTEDEMCQAAFIAWPAPAAVCTSIFD
jgi:hypothetical protein